MRRNDTELVCRENLRRQEKRRQDKRITKRRGGDRRGEHASSTPLHSHRKD
jgi:hypothetical protein